MYLVNTRFPVVVLFCSRSFQDSYRIVLFSLETATETFLYVMLELRGWTVVVFERREGAHPIDELYLVDYVVKRENNNMNKSIIENSITYEV